MENQIYRVQLAGGSKFEIYVRSANETNPHRNIKKLCVCVSDRVIDLDGDLDMGELDSLISYLQDCQEYIKEYNGNSKPSDLAS